LLLWMYTNTKANMDLAKIDEEALPSYSKKSGFNPNSDVKSDASKSAKDS
jgi:hypothetical protein